MSYRVRLVIIVVIVCAALCIIVTDATVGLPFAFWQVSFSSARWEASSQDGRARMFADLSNRLPGLTRADVLTLLGPALSEWQVWCYDAATLMSNLQGDGSTLQTPDRDDLVLRFRAEIVNASAWERCPLRFVRRSFDPKKEMQPRSKWIPPELPAFGTPEGIVGIRREEVRHTFGTPSEAYHSMQYELGQESRLVVDLDPDGHVTEVSRGYD